MAVQNYCGSVVTEMGIRLLLEFSRFLLNIWTIFLRLNKGEVMSGIFYRAIYDEEYPEVTRGHGRRK